MATIRKGRIADMDEVLRLIRVLADFEESPGEVRISAPELVSDFKEGLFDFVIAEVDGVVVGMALYFFRYSTWKGKTLYLEDLVVDNEFRNRGIGRDIMDQLIAIARQNGCYQMNWQVLNWNDDAVRLYERIGAKLDTGWTNVYLRL
jgi:GNAT superfamily N-acetyltransferase